MAQPILNDSVLNQVMSVIPTEEPPICALNDRWQAVRAQFLVEAGIMPGSIDALPH